MEPVKGAGQARLFSSQFLEAFTKTSPTITLVTYVPILAGLFAYYLYAYAPAVTSAVSIFVGGFIFWTFFEYLMHRYIFHFVNESPMVKRFHYLIHGVHHEYPRDHERLFMPPVPGLIILSLIFTAQYLIAGKYVFAFLPGMMSGYLVYAFMHYSIHKFQPPKPLRFIWKHHNMHHFKHQNKAYGVSSPLWDYVFGTMPPAEKEKV